MRPLRWSPAIIIPSALLIALVLPPAARAQAPASSGEAPNSNTWSESDTLRIVREVQHRLVSLPRYGVFDALHFGIHDRTVVLEGFASRPVLKSDAEAAVKSIPSVASVDNRIEVLPASPSDDRIRAALYNRIYSQAALRKYTSAPPGFGRAPSVARMAGGITQDPPIGYNAIHIIVNRGNVTLRGVLNNEGDVAIAGMQANLTPGVFSVDNDLAVQGSKISGTAR